MRFLRQKMIDRLQKIHKGKWTKHIRGIRMHHCGRRECLHRTPRVEPKKGYTVAGTGEVLYTI